MNYAIERKQILPFYLSSKWGQPDKFNVFLSALKYPSGKLGIRLLVLGEYDAEQFLQLTADVYTPQRFPAMCGFVPAEIDGATLADITKFILDNNLGVVDGVVMAEIKYHTFIFDEKRIMELICNPQEFAEDLKTLGVPDIDNSYDATHRFYFGEDALPIKPNQDPGELNIHLEEYSLKMLLHSYTELCIWNQRFTGQEGLPGTFDDRYALEKCLTDDLIVLWKNWTSNDDVLRTFLLFCSNELGLNINDYLSEITSNYNPYLQVDFER
jgi:hypothetical protein